jgi:two-component system sensor histidine kinase DesK
MPFRLRPRDPDLGWIPLIFLVYAASLFIDPIQNHAGWKGWTAASAMFVFLIALYVTGYTRRGRTARVCVAGLVLLGCAYAPFNANAWIFCVYAAAFAGYIFEVKTAYRLLAGMLCLLVFVNWAFRAPPWLWATSLIVTLLVGIPNIHVAAKRRADCKLRLAQEEVAHLAKVAERERIARDLHDVLGHTLSVVVLKSELAAKLMDRDLERARREMNEVEQIAREALAEVRKAIGGYRAHGLAEEFARARATLDTAGIRAECNTADAQSLAGRLSPAQETVLALAVREAVTNVVRHSHAESCQIRLEHSQQQYRLKVEDDGRGGFEQEGNGLRGMRERVEALNGTMVCDAKRGTKLVIAIPAAAPQEAIA